MTSIPMECIVDLDETTKTQVRKEAYQSFVDPRQLFSERYEQIIKQIMGASLRETLKILCHEGVQEIVLFRSDWERLTDLN